MNPIAIKHRDSWPEPAETFVLDREKVKLIVFHGTLFGDDDMDVYGIVMSDGATYWFMSDLLRDGDYAVLSQWLENYFEVIPILNEDEPPTVVWPAEYAGERFFERSFAGWLTWTFRTFPECYTKRKVAGELVELLVFESI